MKDKFNKKYLIIILLVLVLFLGASYALFTEIITGEKYYKITSEGLKIYLDESNTQTNIELTNTTPVSDEVGLTSPSYNFSLTNEEEQDLAYTIYLLEDEIANLTPSSAIRYNYTRDIDNINITRNIEDNKTEDNKFYLENGIIFANQTYNYTFKMWINLEAGNEIIGTTYSIHLEIDATQTTNFYKETVLNGTDPILTENLIPVLIADDGKVTKASPYKEWYKYEEQRWANAVVLKDNSKEYKAGEQIPESNIESYFVWIPRYKYQLFNRGTYTSLGTLSTKAVQTINIEFETKDIEPTIGSAVGDWHSHPAFQAFDSNGFWVGKFETGYNGAKSKLEAEQNITEPSKVIIKPNVYSWRNINIANAFKTSYDYLRNEESHMMKNTEWGAVAYLQHSKYGSRQNVRINNNNDYKTGYAAIKEPTCAYQERESVDCNLIGSTSTETVLYNTTIGYNASTTGNIYGIYDMSGGSWEYVMGYTTGATSVGGSSEIYEEFFTSGEWSNYFDKYTSTTTTAYNKRILGDATGELGPFQSFNDSSDGATRARTSWYDDYSNALEGTLPWYDRGGDYSFGYLSGIFAFTGEYGGTMETETFRIVLTPKEENN